MLDALVSYMLSTNVILHIYAYAWMLMLYHLVWLARSSIVVDVKELGIDRLAHIEILYRVDKVDIPDSGTVAHYYKGLSRKIIVCDLVPGTLENKVESGFLLFWREAGMMALVLVTDRIVPELLTSDLDRLPGV